MSDNVGLSTPRGSGTSGYVQRNRAFIRPRDNAYGGPHGNSNPRDLLASQQASRLRQPDQGILEHDRKRAIEVRVFALRDELEEKGDLDDDAIDERCDALRKQLTDESQRGASSNNGGDVRQRYKAHQVHEQARAKIVESERLRRALRINKDYQEGEHWRRQDERQQKRKVEDDDTGSGNASRSTDTAPSNDKRRRRRYSNDSNGSSEGGDVSTGRSGRRASPPIKSVEKDHDGRQGRDARDARDSKNGGRDRDDRKAPAKRSPSYSDESEGEIVESRGGRGDKDRARGRRDSRSSRSVSRSPSRSPSRSRSRSRGRDDSYSRSPSRSPRRSRSRSDSQDSR
ncbi:RNA-splicing factor [Sporothrix bragantina]|uniref:RNA-splicing factor n=1 Tax=Sporothrix bragantina TaxID=671064 RepID=A0ABP0CHB4_9PEZI